MEEKLGSCCTPSKLPLFGWVHQYPPLLVAGELALVLGLLELADWLSQSRATSAASSLALLTFLPSYQKRAAWFAP
jgi:hypothetical protein